MGKLSSIITIAVESFTHTIDIDSETVFSTFKITRRLWIKLDDEVPY